MKYVIISLFVFINIINSDVYVGDKEIPQRKDLII
jgi:hypothetical protein